MVPEVQLAKIKGAWGCLQQKVLSASSLAQPPSLKTTLLMLDAGQLRLEANQVSESRAQRPQSHLSEPQSQVQASWSAPARPEAVRMPLNLGQGGTLVASPQPPAQQLPGNSATEFSQVKQPLPVQL